MKTENNTNFYLEIAFIAVLAFIIVYIFSHYAPNYYKNNDCFNRFESNCNKSNGSLGIENAIILNKCDSEIYCIYPNYTSKFYNPCEC